MEWLPYVFGGVLVVCVIVLAVTTTMTPAGGRGERGHDPAGRPWRFHTDGDGLGFEREPAPSPGSWRNLDSREPRGYLSAFPRATMR